MNKYSIYSKCRLNNFFSKKKKCVKQNKMFEEIWNYRKWTGDMLALCSAILIFSPDSCFCSHKKENAEHKRQGQTKYNNNLAKSKNFYEKIWFGKIFHVFFFYLISLKIFY